MKDLKVVEIKDLKKESLKTLSESLKLKHTITKLIIKNNKKKIIILSSSFIVFYNVINFIKTNYIIFTSMIKAYIATTSVVIISTTAFVVTTTSIGASLLYNTNNPKVEFIVKNIEKKPFIVATKPEEKKNIKKILKKYKVIFKNGDIIIINNYIIKKNFLIFYDKSKKNIVDISEIFQIKEVK